MPLRTDISEALKILEELQESVNNSNNKKLQAETKDDLTLLISTLQNPILHSIATIHGSLIELDSEIAKHPSILPADFNINESGELELSTHARSLYDDESEYQRDSLNGDFDDQQVPVANVSPLSHQDSPSQVSSAELAPIITPTYIQEFQKVIEEAANGREIITIQLYKPDKNSLGFSVVGLRSEAKGELGIFIQEIQPNGIAGKDGKLKEGDEILAIDGQPLDANISHQQAIGILQQAHGVVELVVARAIDTSVAHSPSPSALSDDISKPASDMVLSSEWAQVEIIDLINDGTGLGFGIVGGRSTGVVVKTILAGGVADRDGRLQSGDHILQIGEVNLRGMGSEQVASVLRQSGSHVRIVVARPVDHALSEYQAYQDSDAPIVPTSVLADADELNRYFVENGYPEVNATPPRIMAGSAAYLDDMYNECDDATREGPDSLMRDSITTLPILTMGMMPPESADNLPEMEKFNVELRKDKNHGLGITIVGYVCEKEGLSGIFVKSIIKDSAADLSGKIKVNDRIVEADGKSLHGLSNYGAVELLRSTGQVVNLSLERYLRGPKYENLQQAIANGEEKPSLPPSPSIVSLPRYPIIADEESTMIYSDKGDCVSAIFDATNSGIDLDALIDEDYEGPLKATVDAALQAKWGALLPPDVQVVVAQLSKFSPSGGLGISLEGTVDVENGVEMRPHHYIRSILPEGPIGKNGKLRTGDELLEVNGNRLLDMCHTDVVSILKVLPAHVRIVCARRQGDLPAIPLINTSQDRAAFAARNLLGGSLQSLIPSSDRLVKAKSDGSIASVGTGTESSLSKVKSRSLEPVTGLAMWSSEVHVIELVKGERGLGFSILDYQDPMNPSETVIVIRSLVPGGIAQMDGRLIPGDRLISVNDSVLENASLDQAVQLLKGAPKGVVRIGVAKPLPIPDNLPLNGRESQDILKRIGILSEDSRSSSTSDEQSMHSCLQITPSSSPTPDEVDCCTSVVPVDNEMSVTHEETCSLPETNEYDSEILDFLTKVVLPISLERKEKIRKVSKPLGVLVTSVGDGLNGMLVSELHANGAMSGNGVVKVGDLLTSVNNENLRRCTLNQAKTILQRADLISATITVSYFRKKDIFEYKRSLNDALLLPVQETPSLISPSSSFVDYAKFRPPIRSKTSLEKGLDPEEQRETITKGEREVGTRLAPLKSEPSLTKESGTLLGTQSLVKESERFLVKLKSSSETPPHPTPSERTTFSSSGKTHFVEDTRHISSEARHFAEETGSSLRTTRFVNDAESPSSETRDLAEERRSSSGTTCFVEQTRSPSGITRSVEETRSPSSVTGHFEEESRSPSSRTTRSVEETRSPCSGTALSVEETRSPSLTTKRLVEDPTFPSSETRFSAEQTRAPTSEKKTFSSGTKPFTEETTRHISESNLAQKARSPTPETEQSSVLVSKNEIKNESGNSLCISEIVKKPCVPKKPFRKSVSVDYFNSLALKNARRNNSFESSTDNSVTPSNFRDYISPPSNSTDSSSQLSVSGSEAYKSSDSTSDLYKSSESTLHKLSSSSEDFSLKETQQELINLAREFRLGSVDEGPKYAFAKRDTLKRLHRFASTGVELDENEMPSVANSTNYLFDKHWGTQKLVSVIREENQPLGISIVGGKVDVYDTNTKDRAAIIGIFIKNVVPDSPAGRSKELQAGDKILEVNGLDLRNASHKKAVETIKAAGNQIEFLVQSLNKCEPSIAKETSQSNGVAPENNKTLKSSLKRITSKETLSGVLSKKSSIRAVLSATLPPESDIIIESIPVRSDSSEEDEVKDRDHMTKAGRRIMRNSAGSVKFTKTSNSDEEDEFGYTLDKVKKRYHNLGEVSVIQLQKGPHGLGISLAGHRDRSKMAVFICGINPEGSAYQAGTLHVGDQILEVNGVVLHGRCHLNASAIIKGLEGNIFKIIISRTPNGMQDLAVKPVTQFPIQLKEETPEQKYAKFKGVRVVTLKKNPTGLGIMILEGKHPEMGRGIFISDILEGSVAESAGLKVGEMILSVNKDDLVGVHHDAASALLKNTEGIITFVVCNPKGDEKPTDASDEADKKSATPAQPPKPEEPPPDPAIGPIKPGSECTIEITRENMGLGLSVIGGSDTVLGVIIVHEVYPDGAVAKDGRLQSGDQIVQVNSDDFRSITHSKALAILRQTTPKVTMVVYRDEAIANAASSGNESDIMDIIAVELTKKSGKGLGLSIAGKKNVPGVFVADLVPGGVAATDGRISKGDQILSVNDQDLRKATQVEGATVLKTCAGKVAFKLGRLKVKPSPSTSDNDSVCSETDSIINKASIVFGTLGNYAESLSSSVFEAVSKVHQST